jgi:hypothetical protein
MGQSHLEDDSNLIKDVLRAQSSGKGDCLTTQKFVLTVNKGFVSYISAGFVAHTFYFRPCLFSVGYYYSSPMSYKPASSSSVITSIHCHEILSLSKDLCEFKEVKVIT